MKLGNVEVCDECGAGVTPHTCECSRGRDFVDAFVQGLWSLLLMRCEFTVRETSFYAPGRDNVDSARELSVLLMGKELTAVALDGASLDDYLDDHIERVVLVTHEADGTDTVKTTSGTIRGVRPQYLLHVGDIIDC